MTYESSQIEPYLNERTKTHTHTHKLIITPVTQVNKIKILNY